MTGGFKDNKLNDIFRKRNLEEIIEFVFKAMEHMRINFEQENRKIKNNEDKIKTHLLENYLENDYFRKKIGYGIDVFPLRFEAEIPENYNSFTESYNGRVDIKVRGLYSFFSKKDYYIIECKRIDGTQRLNKAFVEEGVCRFVQENSKYSSYNNSNVLIGFVVKEINICSNTKKIDNIQKDNKQINVKNGFTLETNIDKYYLYGSLYNVGNKDIKLQSIFYNFSSIIE